MENENEIVDSQNDTEVTEDTEETVVDTESTVDLDAEIKKATAPLYARMKQAEADAREAKAKLAQTSNQGTKVSGELSTRDIYALMEAKVAEEDIIDVQEYAQLKKIPISEALKSNVVKTILSDKIEMRKTANATNTGNVRRGAVKVNPDDLLRKARSGEKVDDIDALVEARFAEKKLQGK